MPARLAALLRQAGADLTVREVAELLWLAGHAMADPHVPEAVQARNGPKPRADADPSPSAIGGATPTAPPAGTDVAALYPVGVEPIGAEPVTLERAPSVRALAETHALVRALRHLRRHAPAARSGAEQIVRLNSANVMLDEADTVHHSVQNRLWTPILRRHPIRWLDLVLVVDAAPSMACWRPTVEAFAWLLRRCGAFRTIRTVPVNTDPAATNTALPAVAGTATAGTTMVLLISDGLGQAWHDGRVVTALRSWARTATVAVVDLMPPRLWPGTGVRTMRTSVLTTQPGAANARWSTRRTADNATSERIPIPVLALEPRFVSSWARVVAGSRTWTTVAALVVPDLVTLPEPDSGPERVLRFRARATPTAFRLACRLSAAPLTMPIMGLVQRATLPRSTPAHLAEVLSGDLCVITSTGRAAPTYEFLPGVREELQTYLTRAEALHVVELVGTRLREPVDGPIQLSALLSELRPGHPQASGPAEIGDDLLPLAHIAAGLLRRMGGRASSLADEVPAASSRSAPDPHSGPERPSQPPPAIELPADVQPRTASAETGQAANTAGSFRSPWAGRADHDRAAPDLVRTADGRTLAFRVVGEPGGHPVVVLHGTPGSRSGIQLNAPLLYRNRIQVIFYDRPGYGESDRDERRYVASAADNIESIVNQLAIDRFAVVGWSGGGPHALATAALLPDRVTHAAVLASYAPYDAPDLDWFEGMDPARAKLFPRNEDDRSRCMEHVRLCAERARRDPQWLVDEFRTGAEDADLATLNRLGIRRQLGEGYAEAVRAGPYGWIDDVFALRSAWGFRCDDITVPVRIWHGADDTVVPPTHAQWLAHHIRHATLAIDPNAGHFGAVDLLSDAVLWSLA